MPDNKGKLFSPAEEWRVEIKKRAHLLNDKYNALPESRAEERREVLRELWASLTKAFPSMRRYASITERIQRSAKTAFSTSISPARTMRR